MLTCPETGPSALAIGATAGEVYARLLSAQAWHYRERASDTASPKPLAFR